LRFIAEHGKLISNKHDTDIQVKIRTDIQGREGFGSVTVTQIQRTNDEGEAGEWEHLRGNYIEVNTIREGKN
jgi:hypothetical protein